MIDHISRKYTNHLLDLLDEGILDKDFVILACIKYMAEKDVKEMMHVNDFILANIKL